MLQINQAGTDLILPTRGVGLMESEYTEGTAKGEEKSIVFPPSCEAYEPPKKETGLAR